MNGEFDLELYTIAMTRLNNGFAKVGDLIQDNAATLNIENEDDDRKTKLDKMAVTIKRTQGDFKTALKEFKELCQDIENDLKLDEIRLDDYEPFFNHVQEVFPQSSKDLEQGLQGIIEATAIGTENLKKEIDELVETIDQIIAIFNDIYSIAVNNLDKIKKGELR